MITVAGFNSSIDRLINVTALRPGSVQRAHSARPLPGGKGVHVAQTIAALGEPVRLVGLCDDTHAALFDRYMRERRVHLHAVRSPVPLRQCIAIVEADGRTTEILEAGADAGDATRDTLRDALRGCLASSSAVICTGSLPPGFEADFYASLARDAGMPCLIDASGAALHAAADASPYLLKPNRDEAAELAGHAIDTPADAASLVRALLARGVRYPVVTLGAAGAVGGHADEIWHAALNVDGVRHAVGSGDCFLAGIAVALLRSGDMGEALRLGVACGAANALGDESGWVRIDTVRGLLPRVDVRRLDD